ncbi:MAG: hypothetical protein ACYTHJ_21515, partial [Planctomycetota bacterium]
KDDPDNPDLLRRKFRFLLTNLDRPDDAFVVATKVMKVSSDDADAMASLASDLVLADKGKEFNDLAAQAVQKAIELDPEHTMAAIANFRVLAAKGQEDKALDWAAKSITRLKDDPIMLARFARVLSTPTRTDKCTTLAIEAVDMAIKAEPEKVSHLMTKFDILATCRKDKAAALRLGNYILEKASDDAGALNNFAWELLTKEGIKGDYNELALAAAERCHKLSEGENWMYVDTLALAKFENGHAKEAVELEKKAIELAGDNPMVDSLKEQLSKFEQGTEK